MRSHAGEASHRVAEHAIGAVVFDLEGTLLQTEALEELSFGRAAVELRPELDETTVAESCGDLIGLSRREIAVELLRRFGLQAAARERAASAAASPWQTLLDLKLRAFDSALADPATVRAFSYPRNTALARELRGSGRRTALTTGLPLRQARRVLSALDLDAAFDFVATAGDVDRGKPDPEMDLLAASELGVPPAECLAVEGYPDGVEAAMAAGMRVVAFTTPLTRGRFSESRMLDHCWTANDSHALCEVVDPKKAAATERAAIRRGERRRRA